MCNACNNVCCGSDEFGGCGCDGCDDPDCWSEDNDFEDGGDDSDMPEGYYEWPEANCCARPPGCFVCESVS